MTVHSTKPLALIRILRYAWASPATLAGLVLAIPAIAFGASPRLIEGAIEVAGGGWRKSAVLLPRSFRFAAITFGHVIFGVDSATLAAVRAHEHVHVRQYERWGVLFFVLYPASSFWQLIQGRHPYLDNHFEREAFVKTSRCQARPPEEIRPSAKRR